MRSLLRRPIRLGAVIGLVLSLSLSFNVRPSLATGPWYVAPSGNDNQSCLTPAAACGTINGAILKATSGDTLYVAAGTYTGSGSQVVLLDKALTLLGGWDQDFLLQTGHSIIDGGGQRQGVYVDVDAVLDRFILQNGRAAWGAGGGLQLAWGTVTFSNGSIRNNTASAYGGGVLVSRHLILINSSVIGNSSSGRGGGLDMIGNGTFATATLYNSTVAGNHALGAGGGIMNGAATINLFNSVVAENSALDGGPDCSGAITSHGYNLIGDATDCDLTTAEGDSVGTPSGVLPLEGRLPFAPLQPASPAVDGGDPSGCRDHLDQAILVDQRGVPREAACDMGAFEYIAPVPPPASIFAVRGLSQTTLTSQAFPAPLVVAAVDMSGNLLPGVPITFTAPAIGGSAFFSGTGTSQMTVETDPGGLAATAALMANDHAGRYVVTAEADWGVAPAGFPLTNIGRIFVPMTARHPQRPYFDDFSQPDSGWPVGEDEYVRTEYLNGEYRVLAKQGGYLMLFRAPAGMWQELSVEADIRWHAVSGSSYGLLVGLNEDFSEYYLIHLNTDLQSMRAYHRTPSGFALVGSRDYASDIAPGFGTNHLRVTRLGNGIMVYVNQWQLDYFGAGPSNAFTSVGLVVSGYLDQYGADARFDNFQVTPLFSGAANRSLDMRSLLIDYTGQSLVQHEPLLLDWETRPKD